MGSMGEELRTLRAKADETARLQTELEEATTSVARIQKLYQDEQACQATMPSTILSWTENEL